MYSALGGYGAQMADVKELHPALSFGISCVLVGGLLYLLEASIGVTYSKLEEAIPQFVALPVVSKPRNVRLEVQPTSLRPLVRSTEPATQAPSFPTGPLLGLAASAERVSVEPEMQFLKQLIHPAHALKAPVLAPSNQGALVQEAASARYLNLRPQVATNNDAVQPVTSAEFLPPDEVVVTTDLENSSLSRNLGGSEISSQPSPPPLPLRRPVPLAVPGHDTEPTRKLVDSPPTRQIRPMTLGPAESQTTADQSSRSYHKTVWSVLARHKPAAGQRGSASVSFGINAAGGLAFVRIARSSGNVRIDQLALATVRRAAPFPAPPTKLKTRPYTIRIDF